MEINDTYLNQLQKKLSLIGPVKIRSENWCPMDASGSNFDEAYEMGKHDGERELAQDIRDILGM